MPSFPLPSPPLADGDIVLRPWLDGDLDDAERGADSSVTRYTNVRATGVREFAAGRTEAREAGQELALVIAGEGDRFLGAVSILRVSWEHARGEVGYWLAPWARGRGVAVRAVRLLSTWGLTSLPLARLELLIDVENAPSLAVAERAGYVREGTLRSWERRDGEPRDITVWSLLARELGEAS